MVGRRKAVTRLGSIRHAWALEQTKPLACPDCLTVAISDTREKRLLLFYSRQKGRSCAVFILAEATAPSGQHERRGLVELSKANLACNVQFKLGSAKLATVWIVPETLIQMKQRTDKRKGRWEEENDIHMTIHKCCPHLVRKQ